MKLKKVAFARSSDKGDNVDISLFARDNDGYILIRKSVTTEKVAGHFAAFGISEVERYEVPNLLALKFVLRNALEGGATRCIRADNLGKTFSGALLRMEI